MQTRRFLAVLGAGALGAVLGAGSWFALPRHAGLQAQPVAAAGEDDQQRIVEAVKRVEPSVVALEVTINGTRVVPSDPFGGMFGFGFGASPGLDPGNRVVPFQERASGSGFVYSKDGLIVTNDHVVHGASAVTVVFADGRRRTGKVYSENRSADLALVKVSGVKLPPPVAFAAPQSIQQGEWAIAIGEPYALRDTVTLGVVSGFNRSETIGNGSIGTVQSFKGLMQTSAPINPGNSGGPLVDLNGDVIGVNQSVERPAEGIGFAIPVATVQRTVAALAQHPGVTVAAATRGFLGVTLASLSSNSLRAQIGNYRGNGVVVLSVVGGSPADRAGLQPGDVIVSVNGKTVGTPDAVASIVRNLGPGKVVSLHVWSNGTRKLMAATIGSAPTDVAALQ